MTKKVIDLMGDVPSESLLEYLSIGPRSEAEVLKPAIRSASEFIDFTDNIPSTSVTSLLGGAKVACPPSIRDMTASPTIKVEPGVSSTSRSTPKSATQSPLQRRDSIPHDTKPSLLHRLPREIRLVIHGHVLTGPSDVTLCIPNQSSRTKHLPIFDVTAIMQTNKALCEEAKAVFYSTNRFDCHLEEVFFQWPTPFFVNLPFMKHVSLSFIDDYPMTLAPTDNFASRIDCALGSLITELRELAPNLRTFTLYLLSVPGNSDDYQENLLPNGAKTATALRNLRTEVDRLSIVAFGPPAALQKVRDTVAPKNDWSANTLETWPQFNIPEMLYLAMSERLWGPGEEAIRAWHLCKGEPRVRRKPLEWEEELFGLSTGFPVELDPQYRMNFYAGFGTPNP
ncbi:hypothetical protein N7G274_010180 [Stereocaulon virgatum]|uniref:Uncharacterized protein n=1 Tax=Stereocaulon virgatum TaxID=373712 RepID=A0ABR3ZWD1_9LECA